MHRTVQAIAMLTRKRVVVALLVIGMANLGIWVLSLLTAHGHVLANGQPLGGDFVAFYAAARTAAQHGASSLYDPAAFAKAIAQWGTGPNSIGLTWQYPPHYLLVIAPLAILPFVPAYLSWVMITAAMFAIALRRMGFAWSWIGLVFMSPAGFHAIATGQNGLFTAALIAIAAFSPESRPVSAGLAAGILTMKPHLGVLLPVLDLARGAWRAIAITFITIFVLIGIAVWVYGPGPWQALASMLGGFGHEVAAGVYPIDKMQTVFAALKALGAPSGVAITAQLTVLLMVCGLTFWLLRQTQDAHLSAALIAAGAFLCTPYGYYYELVVLAPAVLVLIRAGLQKGWLPYEQWGLVFCVLAPLALPMAQQWQPIPLGLVIVLVMYGLVTRRILAERE